MSKVEKNTSSYRVNTKIMTAETDIRSDFVTWCIAKLDNIKVL